MEASDFEARVAGEYAHPGTAWMALFALGLIVLIFVAIFALIFYLRHRARNPLETPGTLRDAVDEPEPRDEGPPKTGEPWERPEDWWKGRE